VYFVVLVFLFTNWFTSKLS